MSEPVVMEGRFVCCGKLTFAGHAHDCPSRSSSEDTSTVNQETLVQRQPVSDNLRQIARDLASVAEAAEMLASREWEPSVVDGWLWMIGTDLQKAQRLIEKAGKA